jgi:hypothetical protein
MAEQNLVINEQERSELARVLRNYLGETRVEVHHTHTPGYREEVKHEEEVLRGAAPKNRGHPALSPATRGGRV